MSFPLFRPARFALVVSLALFLGGCAGTAPLQSLNPGGEIDIDGSERDWYAHLRPLDKENMSMAVLNDDEYLYVSMLTSDPTLIRQITMRGLVLWIDPEGGAEQTIGLQFPIGATNTGRSVPTPRNTEEHEAIFAASLLDMEMLRDAGEERARIPANSIPGVATGASLKNGTLFYEVRLPLASGGPFTFAADAAPGETIGVGLESAEIPPELRRQQMLEGAANRPMQGGGTYGGQYGGAAPSPVRMRAEEGVRVWRKVSLAPAP